MKSSVCLQHHATVVTCNDVTVCGSKFSRTVSKHCQHQHSAIHKTRQQYETPTILTVVISKVLLPQSNIMAAFVHSHSNLFSDLSPGLPTYKYCNATQLTVHSVLLFATDILRLLPRVYNRQPTVYNRQPTVYIRQPTAYNRQPRVFNCQHTAIH